MKKSSSLLAQIFHGAGRRALSSAAPEVPLKRCLLVSKVTRYEFEQNRHPGWSPTQLERALRQRGSDYDALIHYHRLQKDFEAAVQAALLELGAEVQRVNRLSYSASLIDWCDVVIPCGGDGTFLLAASRVSDPNKPVMGFNSDPSRSEGRLCLPPWCSRDPRAALSALTRGQHTWLRRSRIRTTLTGEGTASDMHYTRDNSYDPRGSDENSEVARTSYNIVPESPPPDESSPLDRNNHSHVAKKLLPFLALNEVFIGETLSARVSHLQVALDGATRPLRTKSSGLCVSTGTGSTSWHHSINLLRSQSVMELLQLWALQRSNETWPTEVEARNLSEKYNDRLIFPPDDIRIAYSLRELISAVAWPSPKSRGFANSIYVKSRCVDAGLVIDGGMSFPFNDGAEATLEIRPEDALTTIMLKP